MDEFWKAVSGKWWGKILISFITLGLFAASLDASEAELRGIWYLDMAYSMGGRWLISGFLVLCGIAYVLWGICQWWWPGTNN